MAETVHIVALGARTPVGLTAEMSAAAVRAGISRIVLHPFMADWENQNVRGALDGAFDPGVFGVQRLLAMAKGALLEVTAKLPEALFAELAPQVLCALPELRPGYDATEEPLFVSELQSAQAQAGRPVQVKLAARGHAGGLEALARACADIRAGRAEVIVAGGVDSYFDFDTLDWLQEHRQLQNEETRGGFFPGEAAGFVALAGERTLRKRKLQSLGIVRSSGIASESKLIKTDAINTGEGLAKALSDALSGLGPNPEGAHDVYCDLNGERYRSEEWGFALLRVPSAMLGRDHVAPVDAWGDVGAASGPLGCVLAVQAWARGYAHGKRALVWAGSEAGARAAVFLDAPAER